jgi:hypothetical protein
MLARAICGCRRPSRSFPTSHRVGQIFAAYGPPTADSDRVTERLIEADLRGTASHGLIKSSSRPKRFRLKLVNPKPALEVGTPRPQPFMSTETMEISTWISPRPKT